MILLLTKLELSNLFGLNVHLHTRDRADRRRQSLLYGTLFAVTVVLTTCLGGQIYSLVYLGGSHLVPAVLVVTGGVLSLVLGLFGVSLFTPTALLSLPISPRSIAMSRIHRRYLICLLLMLPALTPGLLIYGTKGGAEPAFFLRFFLFFPFLPMFPLALSMGMDLLISALCARSAHKTGLRTACNLLLTAAMLAAPMLVSPPDPALLQNPDLLISALSDLLAPVPMLFWLKDTRHTLMLSGLSLLVFAGVCAAVCMNFLPILSRLNGVTRKRRSYEITEKTHGIIGALYCREARAYFSSALYASNTLVGPLLAVIGAAALLFWDPAPIEKVLPVPADQLIPIFWCAVCCTLPSSCASLSMEGTRIQVLRSLPLPLKAILDSKLLWSLTLTGAAWCLSFLLLLAGRGPESALWFGLFCPGFLVLSSLFGLYANLQFQNYRWRRTEEVVKQGLSSVAGGFFPLLLGLVLTGITVWIPGGTYLALAIPLLLCPVLYRLSLRKELTDI